MTNGNHWRQHHNKLAARDAKIVEEYKSGLGILKIMEKYEIAGYQTVVNVIRAAEAKTKTVIMRPPGVNMRWKAHHEAMRDRDLAIVETYLDGNSIQWVADNFHLAYQTVQKVLRRAEEATGRKIVRQVGVNLRWLNREENGDDVAS